MSDHFTTLQSKGLNSRILEYEKSSDRDKYEHTQKLEIIFLSNLIGIKVSMEIGKKYCVLCFLPSRLCCYLRNCQESGKFFQKN